MPGSGTVASKERKRRVIAAGKIAGKSNRQIAQDAGCSERHVDRVAAEPATKDLVRDLLRPHEQRLKRALTMALDAIDRGLVAKLKTPHDHGAQLSAAGSLREFLELLRVNPKELVEAGQQPPQFTWEEFEGAIKMRASRQAGDRNADR